ncbi:MAG: DHH family phosphoesterase [Hadesarchaea archaeon]|nr:DHH family phosphoesterase [Hadesarchaea archaeon]
MCHVEVRSFRRSAERTAEFMKSRLNENTQAKIVAPMGADGISAAAILAKCFHYYDTSFSVQFTRPQGAEGITELSKGDHNLFVFLDQGSGQMELIHKYLLAKHKDVVIIDHHPGSFPNHPNLACLNPHACGLNGAKDVSASGAAYLVAEQLDLKFRFLVGLAMIGAISDRQEFFSGFTGANDLLAKRAIDLELVRQGEGLRFIGRSFTPILECLRTSTRPYMVGLSGNSSMCRSLLVDLGISPSVIISELQHEQERALADVIFARVGLIAKNEEFQHALWGILYTNMSDQIVGPRDLREYATVLDSCANLKRPEIGFAMAVGDDTAVSDAQALLSSRQEEMLKTLSWFVKKLTLLKNFGNFRYIYCGNEVNSSLLGEAISLLIESGIVDMDRPLLGITDTTSGMVKISARGTPKLAMEGTNIGRALEAAAAQVGGFGGGHNVAAAARIPKERMDVFLTKLNRVLSEEEK